MELILVVEDEYGQAEVLKLFFEYHSFRVALAANGVEALESMRAEKPAVILSDYMMPGMTGAELGTAIRRDEALRDIPFIFMTATSEHVVRRSFTDYDGLLAKPYSLDAMLLLARRAIAHGRRAPAVDESMRHLLKGVQVPPRAEVSSGCVPGEALAGIAAPFAVSTPHWMSANGSLTDPFGRRTTPCHSARCRSREARAAR